MPVSEVKKPPKDKTKATDDDSPWNYVDGKKVRQGRKLPNEAKIQQFLIESAQMLSLADEFTATAILNKSDELAYGYAKLAQEDPRVRKIVTMLTSSSAWAAAMIPTATILVASLWHHGFLPDRIGVPVTMMQELPTMTRQEINEAREAAMREGRAAEARAAQSTHPKAEENGDGNGSSD